MQKTNLKALSKDKIKEFVKAQGLPDYRAKQLIHWIYEKQAESMENITELSKELRKKLSDVAYISNLKLLNKQESGDGTEKFLFGLEDGESIESVLIPDDKRLTLCISSQVGCAMRCGFCLTGRIGFKRNLKAYEIVDQIIAVMKITGQGTRVRGHGITNIVFMGMGEPLLNFDEVVEALHRITEFIGFSKRRITLSTCGIAPRIIELYKKAPHVNLAISLNASNDSVRDRFMPINKKYPIKALLDECRKIKLAYKRLITFEYVIIDGMNDKNSDAKNLVRILKGIPSKINLIPFNPYEGSDFKKPSDDRVIEFQDILVKAGISAFIRKSKGQDILGACGQLKAGYKTKD
ncbi:MAG: 23S rRNA (adenine(2503)-C(2))-methyltransferase RlmN [Nitrospirae bacterium]|nr:23S rRNA (adenine(2503)-C(2))-methyltransferase RlmN [Nitrospirota bacterium]